MSGVNIYDRPLAAKRSRPIRARRTEKSAAFWKKRYARHGDTILIYSRREFARSVPLNPAGSPSHARMPVIDNREIERGEIYKRKNKYDCTRGAFPRTLERHAGDKYLYVAIHSLFILRDACNFKYALVSREIKIDKIPHGGALHNRDEINRAFHPRTDWFRGAMRESHVSPPRCVIVH